jgi:hypothetical protein
MSRTQLPPAFGKKTAFKKPVRVDLSSLLLGIQRRDMLSHCPGQGAGRPRSLGMVPVLFDPKVAFRHPTFTVDFKAGHPLAVGHAVVQCKTP